MNTIPDQQQNIATLQNLPDLSDTTTVQEISELFDVIINTTQSFTMPTDSNVLQITIHNITQNVNLDLNQNDTNTNSNQEIPSSISTANRNITQPSQTQPPSPRNYDPPPLPPQFATYNTLHKTPPQNSSNKNGPDT